MLAYSYVCISYILKSHERTYTAAGFHQRMLIFPFSTAPCEIMDPDISFTVSRHLWDAHSSVAFFHAWHNKPQYCVSEMDFKDVWIRARPDDMDEFAKLMLTA